MSQFCSVEFSWEAEILEKAKLLILYTILSFPPAVSPKPYIYRSGLNLLGSQGVVLTTPTREGTVMEEAGIIKLALQSDVFIYVVYSVLSHWVIVK